MLRSIIEALTGESGTRGNNHAGRASPSIEGFAIQQELIKAKSPVIFDVGAHVGSVTRRYREQFPDAEIYCFEPFPDSFRKLAEWTDSDPRVCCQQKALSSERGMFPFNANRSPATNSLLETDPRGSSYWGADLLETASQVEVDTTTVDAFCSEVGVSNIDILKMDVQGAEYAVLEGARRMLAGQAISLIYTEIIMCPTYKGQHALHEYLALLASAGYQLLDFYNPVKRHGQLVQADVIFLSSSLHEGLRCES